MSFRAMWNRTRANAKEIGVIFGYTFFNRALNLGIQINSYNTRFLLRNMVRIWLSHKYQLIRQKSSLQFYYRYFNVGTFTKIKTFDSKCQKVIKKLVKKIIVQYSGNLFQVFYFKWINWFFKIDVNFFNFFRSLKWPFI